MDCQIEIQSWLHGYKTVNKDADIRDQKAAQSFLKMFKTEKSTKTVKKNR